MSGIQLGNIVGFVDKRQSTAAGNNTDTSPLSASSRYFDRGTAELYLQGQDATYYSDSRLARMTWNDLVMAVRSIADPGSI